MIPVVVHMWMEFDSERSNFLFTSLELSLEIKENMKNTKIQNY